MVNKCATVLYVLRSFSPHQLVEDFCSHQQYHRYDPSSIEKGRLRGAIPWFYVDV